MRKISNETNLTRKQILNWARNRRYRNKKRDERERGEPSKQQIGPAGGKVLNV